MFPLSCDSSGDQLQAAFRRGEEVDPVVTTNLKMIAHKDAFSRTALLMYYNYPFARVGKKLSRMPVNTCGIITE